MSIRFVAGTEDGNVICFDEGARVQWLLRVGKGAISSLYASTRGTLLAATNQGVLARIADKGDKGVLTTRKTSEGRAFISCLEVGEQVIVATDDGQILFCDAATLEVKETFDTSVPISAMAFSGEHFYYGASDGSLHKRSWVEPQNEALVYKPGEDPAEITQLAVRGDHVFALCSSGAIDAYEIDDLSEAPERAFDDAVRMCAEADSDLLAIDGEGAVWRITQGLRSSQAGRIELEDMIVQPVEEGSLLSTCRFDGQAEIWKISPGSLKKQGTAILKAEVSCLAAMVSKRG